MPPAPPFRLVLLLTRALCRSDPLQVLEAAVRGGVDCVQLREKEMSSRELFAWGEEVQALCRRLGVPLVVNDNVEVALALGARGVHVGQDDLPPSAVRRIVGEGPWIGLSTHDLDQLDEAGDLGVDYAGFGPVFATPTKGVAVGLGPDRLLGALAVARVPVVAIGGIGPENAWMLPSPAALAVSSALCGAQDPAEAARRILHSRD